MIWLEELITAFTSFFKEQFVFDFGLDLSDAVASFGAWIKELLGF